MSWDPEAQDAYDGAGLNSSHWTSAYADWNAAGRPDHFVQDEWRGPMGEPTHPESACQGGCDAHPYAGVSAACPRCLQTDCSGAYGGSCAYAAPDSGRTLGEWDG